VHGLDARLIDNHRPRIVRRRVHGLVVLQRGLKVLRDPVPIFPHLLGAIRKVGAVDGFRPSGADNAEGRADQNSKKLEAWTLLAMSGSHFPLCMKAAPFVQVTTGTTGALGSRRRFPGHRRNNAKVGCNVGWRRSGF